MRTHAWRTVALACLLLAAAPLAAQDWAGQGRLQGNIKDEKGNPVVGATITLRKGADEVDPKKPGPKPLTTDKHGHFATLGLAGGTWGVLIEKDGFNSSQGQVQVSEGGGPAPPVNITLRSIDKEAIAKQEAAAAQASAGGQAKEALDRANTLLTQAQSAPEAMKKQKMAEAKAAYEEGLQKLDAIKADKPEQQQGITDTKVSIMQTLAGIDYEMGQNDDAIAKLKQVLAAKPGDPGALKLLIDMLVQTGHEAEAKQYMVQLPAGTKMDPETLLNMGIKAYNANQLDKAFEAFDQVVKDNPDRADAYYYRGLVYLNRSSTQKSKAEQQRIANLAKADFEKLLQLDPNGKFAADAKAFIKDIH